MIALAYATRVPSAPELLDLGKARFLAELDAVVAVYAAAMRPPQLQLPGRRSIMERHASHPSFHAVAVTAGTGGRHRDDPSGSRPQQRGPIVAFAYGFHGEAGQWWHDLVRSALNTAGGPDYAQTWLSDAFEVAEVHVHPDHQGRGIGRAIVLALARPRLERTAVLSTQDADSPARRLYRRLGFADLLTRFSFPGTDPPYAVMGAVLPLRDEPPVAPDRPRLSCCWPLLVLAAALARARLVRAAPARVSPLGQAKALVDLAGGTGAVQGTEVQSRCAGGEQSRTHSRRVLHADLTHSGLVLPSRPQPVDQAGRDSRAG